MSWGCNASTGIALLKLQADNDTNRKNVSKINANDTVSSVKRFATRVADFIDEGVSTPSFGLGLAA